MLLLRLIKSVKYYMLRNKAYNTTYKALDHLSDRELKDIGLNRSHIRRIAQAEANKYTRHLS